MRNNLWVGSGISKMGEIPMLGMREKGLAKIMRGLFANSEQGFWYDPSDTSTLYQDVAGTIPVTAAGQPVGLMLDKGKGLSIGSELNTTASPKMTGNAPVATYDSTTKVGTVNRVDISNQSFVILTGATGGRWYEVSIKNTGSTQIALRNASALAIYTTLVSIAANSNFTGYVYVAPNFVLGIAAALGAGTFIIDTVKEITGNHAYQATSSQRPLYDGTPHRIKNDGIDDKLVTSLPTQLTGCTVLRAVPGLGTQVRYNQTLPINYEDSSDHSGLIAINRALTRNEQIVIMDELNKKAGAVSLETLTFKAFDNNQEGFVYDPNDLSTMYQDSFGITPVTAAGQPVGLMLDKSKGLRLGANIATPTSLIGSGIGGLSFKTVPVSTTAKVGTRYKVSYRVSNYSGTGNVGFVGAAFGSPLNAATASSANGIVSFISEAASSTLQLYTRDTNNADFLDITIQEIQGNHAYQAASASRPILRKNATTSAYYLEFDGVDDYLLSKLGSISSDFTIGAACSVKSSATKIIFSGGTQGYLRTTNTNASVYSSEPVLYARKERDLLIQKVAGTRHTISTGLASGDTTVSGTSFLTPYMSATPKIIGNFVAENPTYAAAMDYYGGFFITKALSANDEANFRQLFNKRMGA